MGGRGGVEDGAAGAGRCRGRTHQNVPVIMEYSFNACVALPAIMAACTCTQRHDIKPYAQHEQLATKRTLCRMATTSASTWPLVSLSYSTFIFFSLSA